MSVKEKALVYAFIDSRIETEKREEKEMKRKQASSSAGRKISSKGRRSRR